MLLRRAFETNLNEKSEKCMVKKPKFRSPAIAKPIAYEERILLFIDFLGFKDIVGETERDPSRLASLISAMDALGDLKDEYAIFKSEQMSQFSDCVALSYSAQETSGVFYLLHGMALAIVDLAARGYLVRGAVTVGPLYHSKSHVVGPAMVAAYEMESKQAMYPRVIVDPKVFKIAAKHRQPNHDPKDEIGYVRDLIREDTDGQWFCDYVSWNSVVAAFGLEDEAYGDYLYRLSRLIERGLSNANPMVAQKYLWLHRQYLESIDKFSAITPDHDYWQQSPENCMGISELPRFEKLANKATNRVARAGKARTSK